MWSTVECQVDHLLHQVDQEEPSTDSQLCQTFDPQGLLGLLHPMPDLREDVEDGGPPLEVASNTPAPKQSRMEVIIFWFRLISDRWRPNTFL